MEQGSCDRIGDITPVSVWSNWRKPQRNQAR